MASEEKQIEEVTTKMEETAVIEPPNTTEEGKKEPKQTTSLAKPEVKMEVEESQETQLEEPPPSIADEVPMETESPAPMQNEEENPVVKEISQSTITERHELVTDAQELVTEALEMITEAQEPVADTQEPVAEAQEPVTAAQEPVAEAQEPVAEVREPVAEAQEPVAEAQEPVAEAQEPVAEVQEPVAEAQETVAEAQEPVAEAQEPVAAGQEPVAEAQELVTGEMKSKDVPVEEKIQEQEKENTESETGCETSKSSKTTIDKVENVIQDHTTDDWDVLGTDDEKDESGDKKRTGAWMPDINVIIDLYQKLDKNGVLELKWKCPGRRLPLEEVSETKKETEKTEEEVEKMETAVEKQEDEPTEFDFDVDAPSVTSMAPRRTPGSGQALGSGKKRVARMDKIFNDMLRHQRIDEELARGGEESDDTSNRTDTTPQRPVGKFRIRKDF